MHELLSPELALVDPDLAARARAALPDRSRTWGPRAGSPRPAPVAAAASAPERAESSHHPYPLWARVTAALWVLVLGILIGGAAVPHAQDKPRVLTKAEQQAAICEPASEPGPVPSLPGQFQPGP